MHRRSIFLLPLSVLLTAGLPARAQQAPTLRIVVPFAAGAGTDILARAVALQLGPRLGMTVVVENRGGGGGMIGANVVAKGPKDGSVLLFTSSSLASTAAVMKTVPFSFTTDLVPVAVVANGPMVVGVSAASGIKTPADLVAFARKKDGGIVACSGGIGSVGHLAAESLADAAGVPMRHIPYKGAAPALIDLAAGAVDVLIASYSALAPQIRSGRVVPIAVTSLKPLAAFPELPPMATAAPNYQTGIFYGLFAPSGIPTPLLTRLNKEVNEIAAQREFGELLQADSAEPVAMAPTELMKFVQDDYARWKKIATDKQIVIE